MGMLGADDRNGWGCSSAGRAPALQAGGQRFDPAQLHHFWLGLGRRTTGDGLWPCEASLRLSAERFGKSILGEK